MVENENTQRNLGETQFFTISKLFTGSEKSQFSLNEYAFILK